MTTDKQAAIEAIIREFDGATGSGTSQAAAELLWQARQERDAALKHAGYEEWKAEFDSMWAERDEARAMLNKALADRIPFAESYAAAVTRERDALQREIDRMRAGEALEGDGLTTQDNQLLQTLAGRDAALERVRALQDDLARMTAHRDRHLVERETWQSQALALEFELGPLRRLKAALEAECAIRSWVNSCAECGTPYSALDRLTAALVEK